jgi:hypothetical protein
MIDPFFWCFSLLDDLSPQRCRVSRASAVLQSCFLIGLVFLFVLRHPLPNAPVRVETPRWMASPGYGHQCGIVRAVPLSRPDNGHGHDPDRGQDHCSRLRDVRPYRAAAPR